jgi:Na+-transporting methylmalonyl-CoA/oxaloacetate decarboxylase gamma subunit
MVADWTWAQAGQIGGVGFGLVFAVLIILAVAVWVVGLVIRRIGAGKGEAEEKKKGD